MANPSDPFYPNDSEYAAAVAAANQTARTPTSLGLPPVVPPGMTLIAQSSPDQLTDGFYAAAYEESGSE
jgi:hypothetical protein